jgi:hypothetical protein
MTLALIMATAVTTAMTTGGDSNDCDGTVMATTAERILAMARW